MWNQWWLVLFLFEANASIICYNCSSSNREWNNCGGEFVPSTTVVFNLTRRDLVNCTGDNPMCFVRSWTARSRHAWIVQRGCYQAIPDDPLPLSMNTPTRSMSCKRERYPEAEYVVCLCQADWCNAASTVVPSLLHYFTKLPRYIIKSIIGIY